MTINDTANITVFGAGSMGHGIAQVAAIAGYDVMLRDVDPDVVEDGYQHIDWSLGKLAEKGRIDVRYLRPARDDLLVEAEVARAGDSVGVTNVEVRSTATDCERKAVAVGRTSSRLFRGERV